MREKSLYEENKAYSLGSALSRRNFLFTTGLTFSVTAVPWINSAASAQGLGSDFRSLSEFLTAKPISQSLADRAQIALATVNPGFAQKVSGLISFLKSVNAASIDAIKDDPRFAGQLKTDALTIVSAYYLGFAGTPDSAKAEDNTVFITYTAALMYRLTYEHTPIPSYSRWGTGYWSTLSNPT